MASYVIEHNQESDTQQLCCILLVRNKSVSTHTQKETVQEGPLGVSVTNGCGNQEMRSRDHAWHIQGLGVIMLINW